MLSKRALDKVIFRVPLAVLGTAFFSLALRGRQTAHKQHKQVSTRRPLFEKKQLKAVKTPSNSSAFLKCPSTHSTSLYLRHLPPLCTWGDLNPEPKAFDGDSNHDLQVASSREKSLPLLHTRTRTSFTLFLESFRISIHSCEGSCLPSWAETHSTQPVKDSVRLPNSLMQIGQYWMILTVIT